MSWQVWAAQRRSGPVRRRAALLCGLLALVVVETVGRSPASTRAYGAVGAAGAPAMRRLALVRPGRSAQQRLGARAYDRGVGPLRGPRPAARPSARARSGSSRSSASRAQTATASWSASRSPCSRARAGRWRPRRRWPPPGARSACRARSRAARPRSGRGRRPRPRSAESSSAGSAPLLGTKWAASPSGAARPSARPRCRPRRSSAGAPAGPACRRAAPRRRSPPRCASLR